MDASERSALADKKAHHGPPDGRWQASARETVRVRFSRAADMAPGWPSAEMGQVETRGELA
jgi:hypothetical protein